MKYLMFMVDDPGHSDADEAAVPPLDWFADIHAASAYQLGVRLHETDTATTVRVRDGRLLITDGPFSESEEWISGFAIVDCADLDEAIEIAARNPMAHVGRIELRPIHSMGGPTND